MDGENKINEFLGKIIDVHTHAYPEKIAEKASAAIGRFYGLPMKNIGTISNLLSNMNKYGVCHSFIHGAATTNSQVRPINDFLIDLLKVNKNITAFGTVLPQTKNPCDEINYMRANRITGIKFHNDFQEFMADDPEMDEIYSFAQEKRIPIMLHAGDKRYRYSNPDNLLSIYKRFPDLIIIAAHLGGYSVWKDAYEKLCNTPFYFDTSSTFFGIEPDLAKKIIEKKGEDYILFGSDFPMWNCSDEYKMISQLNLSYSALEKIMFLNAEKFLNYIKF